MSGIKIVINGLVTMKGLPGDVMGEMKKDLTIDNPKYEKLIRAGQKTYDMDPFIPLYIPRGSSSLIVPRGYMNRAMYLLRGKETTIIDNTVAPELCEEFQFTGDLREYQEEASVACTKRRYGILDAATGSGKTVMALSTIPIRNTTTLIIVHNTELLHQWQERIKAFLGYDCGLLGNGHNSIKPLTVGIINTVAKRASELAPMFGYCIYDECHRTIGGTWLDTINTLYPRYHLGCTATSYRSDGTTRALYAVVGPKFHTVDKIMLEQTGAIAVPEIIKVNTGTYIPKDTEMTYSQVISNLCSCAKRNTLIAENVYQEFMHYKDPILVVSDRKEHCDDLYSLINAYQFLNPVILHGGVKKSDRKKLVEDFKKGKYNVLIATVSLIGEGFDSPSLGALFMATPIKFNGRLLQVIGRILRPNGKIKPRVYDFRDYLVTIVKYSGFARDRMYKANKWE